MTDQHSENKKPEKSSINVRSIVALTVVISSVSFLLLLFLILLFILPVSSIADLMIDIGSDEYRQSSYSHVNISSSLYESMIAFLIALNAFIAGFSIFYIKANTEGKLEEIVERDLYRYFNTRDFAKSVEESVESKGEKYLRNAQVDLVNIYEKYDSSIEEIDSLIASVKRLKDENADLRSIIAIVSKQVSLMDNTEDSNGTGRIEEDK